MKPPPSFWEGKPLSATDLTSLTSVSRQGQISAGPGTLVNATSRGSTVALSPRAPVRRPKVVRMVMSQGGGETAITESPAALEVATITYDDESINPATDPELAAVLLSVDGKTHTFTQDGLFLVTFKAVVLYTDAASEAGAQPPEIRAKGWLQAAGTDDVWESESYTSLPLRQNISNLLFLGGGGDSGIGSGSGDVLDLTDFARIEPYATDLYSKGTVVGQALVRVVWTDDDPPVLKIKRGATMLDPTLQLLALIEQIPGNPTDHLDGAAAPVPAVESGTTTLSFVRQ